MKYTSVNLPLQCPMTQSTWYKGAGTVQVRGVCWHSTGANNPTIKRYVQPDDNAANKAQLIALIGKNNNANDWNHIYREAGVNAWIGKLADGTVATVQVGPLDKKAWGVGSGSKGSCNNGWVQFEICEDALTDKAYFDAVYKEACEFTAYVCRKYNLNPKGTTNYLGINVPIILCHQDTYKLGLGGNHGDVYHWFNRYGKTMDDVRNDVYNLIQEQIKLEQAAEDKKKEDVLNMDKAELTKLIDERISARNPFYADITDIPSYWKDPIQTFLDLDILNGGTAREVNATDINLTQDTIKALVLLKLYIDKILQGKA